MLEFSRMTEYEVPPLELWEEYLVYATMMGISRDVCEQLRLVYPQLNDTTYLDTFGGSYMRYMFFHQMGAGLGNRGNDFGSILGSVINDVSTAATRLAHPPLQGGDGSFSGRGFGGGGGLGGRGGGGGGFGSGGGGFGVR
jgi:uncharacterized membrane protein